MEVTTANIPLRLGFAVKVLGRPDMHSHDTRRWQNNPHLRVSLEYLNRIFDYLKAEHIAMYRMSSDLAPYLTHPDMPQFHKQIAECRRELQLAGDRGRALGLRLSFHPSQFVVLNSPDETLVRKSIADIEAQAALLDAMGLGPEAVVVVHIGGLYGDRAGSIGRFIRNHGLLNESARRRLVVENDDVRFTVEDVLRVHAGCGAPVVYDYLHHMCNPDSLSVGEALRRCAATWPANVRPKMHFSSPRTEMKAVRRKSRTTGKLVDEYEPPQWTNHADYLNPFEFVNTLRQAPEVRCDVMLEAKAKDLALLRLRKDLLRYAPDLAERFGLTGTAERGAPVSARLRGSRGSSTET